MAKRKLSDAKKTQLKKALLKRIKTRKGASMSSILREIGKKFGVSAEAVRYYMSERHKSPGKIRKKNSGEAVRALRAEALKHRRLAKEEARKHLELAKKYERAARQVVSLVGE
jgi:Zn-dependent peptidase ImmA (M78 family)